MKKRYILIGRVLLLVAGYRRSLTTYGGIEKTLISIVGRINEHQWSILLLGGLYFIRPFLLLPVSRLSIIAGVFWGRRPGLLLALLGEMISAIIAYGNGRYIGPQGLDKKTETSFARFHFFLLRYPLFAVFLSRLTPIPDDVLNYGRGMIRVSRHAYFWGTLLGNAVFTTLNVAMGAQIDPETLFEQGIRAGVDFPSLIIIGTIYVIIIIATTRRRKKSGKYLHEHS